MIVFLVCESQWLTSAGQGSPSSHWRWQRWSSLLGMAQYHLLRNCTCKVRHTLAHTWTHIIMQYRGTWGRRKLCQWKQALESTTICHRNSLRPCPLNTVWIVLEQITYSLQLKPPTCMWACLQVTIKKQGYLLCELEQKHTSCLSYICERTGIKSSPPAL